MSPLALFSGVVIFFFGYSLSLEVYFAAPKPADLRRVKDKDEMIKAESEKKTKSRAPLKRIKAKG
jgi:hypothetical protein